ncbi:2992_t:CDS:1, partial [Paraglomus brasilianum]
PAGISLTYSLKNMSTFRLNCLVHGNTTERVFPVDIPSTKTIGDLKEMIKIKQPKFDRFSADELDVWKVDIPCRSLENPVLKALKENPMADIEGA